MIRTRPLSWLALVLFVTVAPAAAAEPTAHEKLLPSTVFITALGEKQIHVGTGTLIDRKEKLVVTCMHVLSGEQEAVVYFPILNQGKPITAMAEYLKRNAGIKAKVVATAKDADLALLKLERVPAKVPAVPLAENGPPPGTPVFAVGNSGNDGNLLENHRLWKQYSTKVARLALSKQRLTNVNNMQLSTWAISLADPVQPGDSGGPLVDATGRLVGVVFGVNAEGGFAIDVDELHLLLARHRAKCGAASLAGHWTAQFQNKDGDNRFLRMSFHPDGRMEFLTDRRHDGTFELNENKLTMVVPSLKINETVTITRKGDNEFRFVSAGLNFTVTRR